MPQDLLKSMKKNTRDTVFVANKNDSRIKKYQDSLDLYKKGLKDKQKYINVVNNAGLSTNNLETYSARTNDKISPISQMSLNNRGGGFNEKKETFTTYTKKSGEDVQINDATPLGKYLEKHPLLYKKPTQPVKYRKVEVLPNTESSKAEIKVKGSKKYFINENQVDEKTFNKIAPIKSMKKNEE